MTVREAMVEDHGVMPGASKEHDDDLMPPALEGAGARPQPAKPSKKRKAPGQQKKVHTPCLYSAHVNAACGQPPRLVDQLVKRPPSAFLLFSKQYRAREDFKDKVSAENDGRDRIS